MRYLCLLWLVLLGQYSQLKKSVQAADEKQNEISGNAEKSLKWRNSIPIHSKQTESEIEAIKEIEEIATIEYGNDNSQSLDDEKSKEKTKHRNGQEKLQKDVELAMRASWWKLARTLILQSHALGIDVAPTVRNVATDIRNHLDELTRLLDKQHDEITVVSPAFQWAQSPRHIFLNIKFAYRWSSPGALSVEDSNFESKDRYFFFSGLGKHSGKLKRFELRLNLLGEIVPEKTIWNFASVGKVVVTLAKKDLAIWERLTKETAKISNMNVWWDMKEKTQQDITAFESGNYTESIDAAENVESSDLSSKEEL